MSIGLFCGRFRAWEARGCRGAGMPDFVLDDERRCDYVLLHGADEFESGWEPAWISPGEAGAMLGLLRSRYPNPIGLELLQELEKRANAKASA